MKWSIFELQKLQGNELLLDETLNFDELKKVDDSIRQVSPIKVTGKIDIKMNRFTFNLKISGDLTLACSRTLLDVEFPVQIETRETFFNVRDEERGEEDDIDGVNFVEANTIDLRPIIRELLILEVPMQVYADDVDNEAAAPQSGDGWEVIEEEEETEKIDPRLAKLAKFFDDNDQEK